MEYLVLTFSDTHRLERRVEEYLSQGWLLQGGISIAYSTVTNNPLYAQALVKPDSKDPS